MQIKADLHIHTNQSNDGLHSLAQMLQVAAARGLAAIAVSDHNRSYVAEDAKGLQSPVLIIPACEVSTQDGHILGLFLDAPLDMPKLTAHGLPTGRQVAAEIRSKGGLVIAAHPFQKAGRFQEKVDLCDYVDGIESANARACFKNAKANDEALAYAKVHKLLQTGGSDAHSKYEVGNAYTLIEAEECSLQSLKEAVKKGRSIGILQQNTACSRKGASQFCKACRSKHPFKICRSVAYWAYCMLLDMKKK